MQRPTTRQQRQQLLREARALIRRRYADPDLDLRDVAEAVGASTRQLQRVFGESGEDFRSYLLRVRMTEAMRLITRDKNPLAVRVACRRVGYRQASGLRQAFVRFYGFNPSEVQRKPPQYIGDTEFDEEQRPPLSA